MASPNVIILVGPTASGKTASALAISHKLHGAVISADSRQVYAELNRGTAKPPEAWQQKPHASHLPDTVESIPHYLLNIARVTDTYTLSQWKKDATHAIDTILAHQHLPIVTGGTMLYIDSILFNYDLPAVAPNIPLRTSLEQKNSEELYHELLEKDPAAKTFIEPHNKRRIIRALEVMDATHTPFSDQRVSHPSPYTITMLGLFPGWEVLEKNIRTRAREMMGSGLIEETKNLMEQYSPSLPLLQTMNYKQALDIIHGVKTHEQALDEMVRVNMRYAHRQMAWWKKNNDIVWFPTKDELLKKASIS